jgi:hypothetical protein
MAGSIDLLRLGESVKTALGLGVVQAISRIDSVVYVTLSKRTGLYIFRPEQLEQVEPNQYLEPRSP